MMGMRKKKLAWGSFVAVVAVLGGVLFAAAPAQAASFCYEGGTTSTSKSLAYYDIVVTESLTYKPMYTCSGVRVGVHVTAAAASYTGGSASSTVGINQFGVVMQQVGGETCGPVGPSLVGVSPARRGASGTFNSYVYTGTYKTCFGANYTFDQTCTFIQLNQAFHIGVTPFSGTFRMCLNASAISPEVEM